MAAESGVLGRGLHILWIEIEIELGSPVLLKDAKGAERTAVSSGMLQAGVTSYSQREATELIKHRLRQREDISTRQFTLTLDHVGEIPPDQVQSEIHDDPDIAAHLIGDPYQHGVWFQSGVAWYDEKG